MMWLTRIGAVTAALAVGMFAVPGPADAGRMIERDLHISYTAQYQAEPQHTCEPGGQANLLLGDGVGSLLGRFDLRIEGCAYADPTGLSGTVDGVAYYVTANGDQIQFGFAGTYVVDLDAGQIVATMPGAYASGTGRFANVELIGGEGAVDISPLGSGMSYGTVDGVIAYDASDRADR